MAARSVCIRMTVLWQTLTRVGVEDSQRSPVIGEAVPRENRPSHSVCVPEVVGCGGCGGASGIGWISVVTES